MRIKYITRYADNTPDDPKTKLDDRNYGQLSFGLMATRDLSDPDYPRPRDFDELKLRAADGTRLDAIWLQNWVND